MCLAQSLYQGNRMAKNIQSKKIKVDGLDIRYFTGGQGDPLIVIHGGGDGARAWMKNVTELAGHYTVYVPDLPGYGYSQPIDGDYYIPELTEFIEEFSRILGLKSFHLMGHSLGGGIALSYVLKFPYRVTKLVLVSSMCLGREIAPWVRFLSNCVLCKAMARTILGILRGVKWVAGRLFATVEFVIPLTKFSIALGSKLTTLKEQTTVLVSQLSEVMVPTLVVWGAKDGIVPARQAYAAARLIPDCQVKVFEGSGHSVYRERIPEFSQTLTDFLG